MRILGIDPGYAIVGFGVVESDRGNFKAVDYGVIETSKELKMPQRLNMIWDGMNALIDRFQPDHVAVEELFYFSNAKTVIPVAQARGVILLSVQLRKIDLFEYTPLQIKQAITGYGNADKAQMQQMIKVLLNLSSVPRPDDAADALCAALCHAQTAKFAGLFKA